MARELRLEKIEAEVATGLENGLVAFLLILLLILILIHTDIESKSKIKGERMT